MGKKDKTCILGSLYDNIRACLPAYDGKVTSDFGTIPFMTLLLYTIASCNLTAFSF